MPPRLSQTTLSRANGAALPRYDRATMRAGIVHLGVGAFHRAHQAVYVDYCLNAGDAGWGIVGASLRSRETRDALAPQDGLYTVAARSGDGDALRLVGALKDLLVAPESPEALLDAMADPAVRIVTLTVTEKAYLRAASGDLDDGHPDVAWDLANPGRPRGVHGFLIEALARRREAGERPFTVLCCDNLPANGATLRRLALQFAEMKDKDLACHIAGDVAFPSTMVDRIVPATTDADRARIAGSLGLEDAWPVMTEPFSQWVMEEDFTAGRPRWEDFGVTMVADVRPYEEMKLRLLNGAHSGIAYLGLLLGHETVSDAFADPRIRRFVDGLWAEAAPTLPAGLDVAGYTPALAARFANPALRHRTAQIAMDGSQKLEQRVMRSALACLDAGRPPARLTLVAAAWIACCEARGGRFPADLFTDPLDARLAAILPGGSAGDAARAAFDAAGFAAGAEGRDRLVAMAAGYLEIIRRDGADAAIAAAGGSQT